MIKHIAILAGLGLAFLAVQPVLADEEWAELEADFAQAQEKWQEAMQKLQGQGSKAMFNPAAMPPQPIEKFRPKFREYAEKHEGKSEALPALGYMLMPSFGFPGMGAGDKSAAWALAQLKQHHAADPKLRDHIEGLRMAVMSVGEQPVIEFLEAVAEKNPDSETKGIARLTMAEILYEGSPFAMMMGGSDTAETKAKKKRAIKILRAITSESAGTHLAERAGDFLFAIDHLQVGMKAPEIVGVDANGREIRLSQFNGQVVAIVFWATWCAPCMQMIPHERELIEHHAGKPFTILGINADETLAGLKKTIEKENITWPTIFDGAPDVSKIAKKWRIRSLPAIYVLDHHGVIRHDKLAPFQLENAVNTLVAEAVNSDAKHDSDG